MKKNTYHRLAGILQKRRAALRKSLTHDLTALRHGVGLEIGDSVDEALDDEFNSVSSQLAQTESRELAKIEEALQRIRDGEYGICEGCDEQIPLARLEAVPYATRCVNCQREMEQRQGADNSRIDWSAIRDMQDDEPSLPSVDDFVDVR